VGAGLARDAGDSVCLIDRVEAIAGKPAPTLDIQRFQTMGRD